MTNYSTSCIHHPDYSEHTALQQLLTASYDYITECNSQFEKTSDYDHLCGEFTVTVGGKSVAFLLGGPQQAALEAFIDHIAAENGYSVDRVNMTVTE